MASYINTTAADSLTGTMASDDFTPPSGGTGAGRDSFYGYGGADYLYGGLGRDTLYGGDDRDRLEGGDDDDRLYGGNGDDDISGGQGNDVLFGGAGYDELTLQNGVTMTIGIGTTTVTSGGFQISFAGFESFNLADFANDVTGTAADDRINGGEGNDTIRGLDGEDFIVLGNGNDVASGGNDNDHLIANVSGGNKRVFGGQGEDTIFMGSGRDTAYGGSGDDIMLQGTESGGIDVFYGEAGNDFMQSAGGNDSLYGGNGNDTISLYSATTLTIDLRLATQTVMFDGFSVLLDSFENAAMNAPRTRVTGNADANKFNSYDGDDVIIAMGGNDTIQFGQGADRVYGGNGDDFIDHGSSFGMRTDKDLEADLMSGGAGADTFRFLSATSSPFGTTRRDTITDFTRGSDKIDLSQFYDPDRLVNADVNFTFVGRAAYTRERGELRFAGGVLQGDVNGDGITDFAVNLTGVTALTAADLIL